ncbi:hypothetical protein Vadar_021201 [Vaccinium darrowii]|uniref:Uncharacterized protein n=1 Tax=Vaccinium darrowii TaxID=229202 RepID=A0ACB7Y179_9ERIC|nr:hypothetical protein Vadar_021201 [Vaccinium darrowii]
MEMAEMELFFSCQWKLLALIYGACILLSMTYPPFGGLRVNPRTVWGFILFGLAVYAAILIEYEIRLRRDYEAAVLSAGNRNALEEASTAGKKKGGNFGQHSKKAGGERGKSKGGASSSSSQGQQPQPPPVIQLDGGGIAFVCIEILSKSKNPKFFSEAILYLAEEFWVLGFRQYLNACTGYAPSIQLDDWQWLPLLFPLLPPDFLECWLKLPPFFLSAIGLTPEIQGIGNSHFVDIEISSGRSSVGSGDAGGDGVGTEAVSEGATGVATAEERRTYTCVIDGRVAVSGRPCPVLQVTLLSCFRSMVNAIKGLLSSCDIPMAQFIINLDNSLPPSQKFIIHTLDSTHLFVQPHVSEMIRSAIAEFRDQNSYEKPA